MSRDTIGGSLDRERYRPSTPGGRRLAVLELHRQGLKARDVAATLRLSLAEVLEVLRAEAEHLTLPPAQAPAYSRKAWVRHLAAQGCDCDEIAAALALDPTAVAELLHRLEGKP